MGAPMAPGTGGRIDAAARHGDQAPAVRRAQQFFLVERDLIAGVQIVRHRTGAQRVVVGHLPRVAIEVQVVELLVVADRAAARADAVVDVAVAIDEGLNERVVGRLPGNRRGHVEFAQRINRGEIQP